ncbi:hypothetical protein [Dehalobacterium formicoaceticum]|uniref:Uncharacterized protein n=1 Tax=Dehalobacterium formicoaceticum TaxID=51515 RepID=A0ABT1Y7U7_9FIRM|nr:hypothetical protein [Dehalobacterium formicoaceticum]MCR6546571.1 hypothetical protein [Dehalobacterium formicoaceticum]
MKRHENRWLGGYISSDAQQGIIPFEDISFVYEQNGKFMLQQYGQPLKELDAEQ